MNVREIPLKLFHEFRTSEAEELPSEAISGTGVTLQAPTRFGLWLCFDSQGISRGYSTTTMIEVLPYRKSPGIFAIARLCAGEAETDPTWTSYEDKWYEDNIWFSFGTAQVGRLPVYLPFLAELLERARELNDDPAVEAERRRYRLGERPAPLQLVYA